MREIKVKPDEVLVILKKNRSAHRAIFLEALDGYRKTAVAELEKRLDQAKRGKRIDAFMRLQQPEDHTKDYDRVIKMLEMTVDDEIMLSEQDFAQYVLDDWSWKEQFYISNQLYSKTAADYVEASAT